MAEIQIDRDFAIEQLRIMRPQMMAMFAAQREGIPIHGEEMELALPSGTRQMMHYPSGKDCAPVYIDVHGGGFTWGTISDGDMFCTAVSSEFGWEAYSLDYPLTPDAEYPTQLNWVYETISYLRAHADEYHIDPDRIVIGGRSAGGNLAAALCLLAKQKGEFQFAAQILDHPWLDLCRIIPWEGRYDGQDALSDEVMIGLSLGYADPVRYTEILCSPLAATKEDLTGLPPAIVQTCELDSLGPEGDLYAKHLEEAGVPVIWHCFEGAIHGFSEGDTEIGEQGRRWLLAQLRKTVDF